jgi:hypothetical protein
MTTVTVGPDIDLDQEEVFLPSGRRYRNADAEADAAYFEARHVGRPSLAQGVSPQVSFRVAPSTKAQLTAKAKATGRTEAAVAREALERYLQAA